MALKAQVSADCDNAIPICNNTPVNGGTMGYGVDDFNGSTTSGCLEQALSGVIESNSAWYRFRTGASGQLGFNIGIDTSEDWDFALYKSSNCNTLGEPVRCNFFDNREENAFIGVGEDPTGSSDNVQYENWLEVTPGEDYYLLLNNFSNSNSGFSIQFSGHIFVTNPYDALDCSIISNLLGPPISACENDTVTLDASISDAISYSWYRDSGSGFMQLLGENNSTLQADSSALYRVEVQRPSENIISDVQVAFSTMPVANSVSDDASCSGVSTYDLSLKDSEVLGSQNPNKFVVSYFSSLGDAANGTNILAKQHSTISGTETIYVRLTSVDNPRCIDVSQNFRLINLETPELNFPSEAYLCQGEPVVIGEEMPNGNYSYLWNTGETSSSITVSEDGTYTLTVTNEQSGIRCSDSKMIAVVTSESPRIMDILIDDLRDNNTVTVLTQSSTDFEFQLDDGIFQKENKFDHVFPGVHTVTVNDIKGCGTVSEQIIIVGFPKFFTPNGDGSNDLWHISGIEELEAPSVLIFNRFGKLLAALDGSSSGWDGLMNGKPLPESDYWFKLTYVDNRGQTITAKHINNHFSLKR